jgi:hypothetical protein
MFKNLMQPVVERSIESRGKTGKGLVRRRTSPFPVLPRLSMLLSTKATLCMQAFHLIL